ncbi:MAG: hypothetical protein ACJ769_11155 [Chloroflexota bacterium]
MTDTEPTATTATDVTPPTSLPGEQRRLARPPSERYREAEAKAAADAAARDVSSASIARGLALALIVSLIGALALVLLGAIATVTTGLIVVAGAIGFGVAVALQVGAGARLSNSRRIILAIALTVGAIGLGQLGIWQYGRAEGGVLPLVDYLAEVFGPLVIVEFVIGAIVAWAVAR